MQTLAQNTNWENMLYYGGLIELMSQTHLGKSTIQKHLKVLQEDGLLHPIRSKKEIFVDGKRQEYSLKLPVNGFKDCKDWAPHNQTSHHLGSYKKNCERLEKIAQMSVEFEARTNFSKPSGGMPDWAVEEDLV
jgi:DNA-binding transcriptional ArsR family regulator